MPTKTYTQSLRNAGKTSARKKLSTGGRRPLKDCKKDQVRSSKTHRCQNTVETKCDGASQRPYPPDGNSKNPRRMRPKTGKTPQSPRCLKKSGYKPKSSRNRKKLSAGGRGKKKSRRGKKSRGRNSRGKKKAKRSRGRLSAGGRTTTGTGQFNRIKRGEKGAGQFAPAYKEGKKPANVRGDRKIKDGYERKKNNVKRRTEPHLVRGLAKKCPPDTVRSNATNKKSSRCKTTKEAKKKQSAKKSGKTTEINGKTFKIPDKFVTSKGTISKNMRKKYAEWRKSKQ